MVIRDNVFDPAHAVRNEAVKELAPVNLRLRERDGHLRHAPTADGRVVCVGLDADHREDGGIADDLVDALGLVAVGEGGSLLGALVAPGADEALALAFYVNVAGRREDRNRTLRPSLDQVFHKQIVDAMMSCIHVTSASSGVFGLWIWTVAADRLGVPGSGAFRQDLEFRVWGRAFPALAGRSDLGRKGRISFCRRCGRRRRAPLGRTSSTVARVRSNGKFSRHLVYTTN